MQVILVKEFELDKLKRQFSDVIDNVPFLMNAKQKQKTEIVNYIYEKSRDFNRLLSDLKYRKTIE